MLESSLLGSLSIHVGKERSLLEPKAERMRSTSLQSRLPQIQGGILLSF
jgi:hypothetical protein